MRDFDLQPRSGSSDRGVCFFRLFRLMYSYSLFLVPLGRGWVHPGLRLPAFRYAQEKADQNHEGGPE